MALTNILMWILALSRKEIKQMENPSEHAGEQELMALVDVVQHPIYVHQITHKNCFGETCRQTASPVHLKYSPEQKLLLLHQSKLHTMICFLMFFTLKLETLLQ